MQPTDLTFGAGFDADGFRDAIRSTMQMGLPNATSERVTFLWDKVTSYDVTDPAGKPYNWNVTPTTQIITDPVPVVAAVEFKAAAATSRTGTPFGEIDTPHVVVTLLDVDYELIVGASKIQIDDGIYRINFVAPPMGLFTVTVYQVYGTAEDER